MYLSVETPIRSLRTAVRQDEELLIIGGNGHHVGRQSAPPTRLVADLISWTQHHFPAAQLTHTWSAQDYQSLNHVPFVGRFPRGAGRLHLATGFNKWGMTNAPMAALMIAREILGGQAKWARVLNTRVSGPLVGWEALTSGVGVGVAAVQGWLGAELRPLGIGTITPPDGTGLVRADDGKPIAISTVDGKTCAVSAVCTHLGGVVRWNDQERSWDCPLHGSRFAANGKLLEGPATSDLSPDHLD